MARHSPARWLAPFALAAAALALVVVLASSLGSSSEESASSQPETQTTTQRERRESPSPATGTTPRRDTPSTYTVQAGDILSEIAEKTGVPVERLQELNPGLDANSMSVGQRLRLE
jgi:LysM repeat protein